MKPQEFVFDGTNKNLPKGVRVAEEGEVFYLPEISVPISNTFGRIVTVEVGKRYALLSSGKIVEV